MLKDMLKRTLDTVQFDGKPVLTNFARKVVRARNELRERTKGERIKNRILDIVSERPLDINIEISNFCAASCVFCPNSKVKRHKTTMEMDLFRKIVDDYAAIGGGAIGLGSMQSDIFSDKLLLDRIRYLLRHKDKLYVYTTTYLVGASKLSDEELKFLLSNFDLFQISLGGTNKEEYRRMYGINAFDVVKAQLLRVAKIVKEGGLKVKLGLYFRTADAAGVAGSALVQELGDAYSTVETRDSFFSWGGIIEQKDLPEGAKLHTVDSSGLRTDCAVSSATLSVNVDGSVVGCGCVDWNSRHIVGNVASHSIKEVWAGKEAAQFRASFSSNRIPDLCKDCSLYISLDEAFSKPALEHYKVTDGLYYLQK